MNVLAFDGAQGYGALATGGRGGRLMRITTTADNESGPGLPGSIREFAKTSGPRIGVFDLPEGTDARINLLRPLTFDQPDFTLAGQTALGKGVCLSGEEVRVNTSNFIIRFIRSRRGDLQAAKDGFNNADTFNTSAATDGIVDHYSGSWGIDETFTLFSDPAGNTSKRITLQNSILTEALYRSRHPEGPHSMGFLVSAVNAAISEDISLIDTLLSNCDQRMPQVVACRHFDMRNCIGYNWRTHAAEFKELGIIANLLANYYKAGPDTQTNVNPSWIGVDNSASDMQLAIFGNVGPTISDPNANNWPAVRNTVGAQVPATGHQLAEPFAVPNSAPLKTADEAYEYVLANAGCRRPFRDAVDTRAVNQVRQNTGRVIDSQSQVGGFSTYTAKASLPDSDGDGLPDAWEDSHGTNKVFAADANEIRNDHGWTNLDIYLDYLARADFVPPSTGGFFGRWVNLWKRRLIGAPPPYRM